MLLEAFFQKNTERVGTNPGKKPGLAGLVFSGGIHASLEDKVRFLARLLPRPLWSGKEE